MQYFYLVLALSMNAAANILLKIAAIGEGGTSIRVLISNPYAILGVFIFGTNVYFYIQALRTLPISLVYPILTASGFLIINTFGILALKEPYSAWTIAGYAAIIAGIAMVAYAYR